MWLCLLLSQAASSAVLELDGTPLTDKQFIAPYVSHYKGENPPNDARAASEVPDKDFVPVGTSSPMRPLATEWFRFSIHNASSSPRSLVLDFDQALYSRLEWYAASPSSAKYVLTGQDYAFASRDIDYDFYAFRIDIPPGETTTVNFVISTPYASMFIPYIIDSESFITEVSFFSRVMGAIIGMLYAAMFFMLIFLIAQSRSALAYAMFWFSFTCVLSVLYINGAIQRMFPDTTYPWRDVAYVLIHGFQAISFAAVLQFFYVDKLQSRWISRLLLTLAGIELMILLSLPVVNIANSIVAMLSVNTLLIMAAMGISILALWRRLKGAYIFSMGVLLFMLASILSVLGSLGWLPISPLIRYGYEWGLTLQVDCILIAVVLHMATVQREKMVAETEVIKLNADIQARSQFVDRITHDIKSPLSAVIGAADLLRVKDDPQEKEQFLGIIQRSSHAVLALIDDILGYSRMQAGQLTLNKDTFSISQLMTDTEHSINAGKQNDKLLYELSVSRDVPLLVEGDKFRLSQLLMNLLTNAIKFTDEGRVKLTVDVADQNAQQVRVRFVIEDTGIGMSEDFLQTAFDPYTREENGPGYRPGFGLGLSICKQLADRMGGNITVVSKLGQGSCFTVVLPFNVVPDLTLTE